MYLISRKLKVIPIIFRRVEKAEDISGSSGQRV